ncbi:MAG TPA: hypothetical protein VL633_05800 [Bacteroidota bacterium]|nr:hypothetical protein [Bacteroidota bacterium]
MNCNALFLILFLGIAASGCTSTKNKPLRNINDVKEAHTGHLMSIPGVTGVYVGENEEHTPCIVVMVQAKTRDVENRIPRELEGHPVIVKETGIITPMGEKPK